MHKLIKQILFVIMITLGVSGVTNIFAAAVLRILPNTRFANINLSGVAIVTYSVTNNTKHPIDHLTVDPSYLSAGNAAGIILLRNQCAPVTLQPNGSCVFNVLLYDGVTQPALFDLRPRVCGYNGAVCSVPLKDDEVQVKAIPHTAFISNFGDNTVSVCVVQPDATLGACMQLIDPTFNGPTSTTFNSAGTLLYVSNYNNNTISVCKISADPALSPCVVFSDPSFNGPNSITSNTDGTFAYVANYNNNTISICAINPSGMMMPCTVSPQPFFAPSTIKLNQAGTFAYVANHANDTLAVCPINNDGSFGVCTATDPGATFHGPTGVSLNTQGTFAYVSNSRNIGGNRNISICPILVNGSLGICTAYVSTLFNFNNFGKISVNSADTYVYVVNQGNNYVTLCSLIGGGVVGSCSQQHPNGVFNSPQGIAVS